MPLGAHRRSRFPTRSLHRILDNARFAPSGAGTARGPG